MATIKELRKLLNYSDSEMYLHKLFSGISVYITKFLLYLPITANQVTIISIIIGLIGIFFLSSTNNLFFYLGIGLLYLFWTLDFCDGTIARYNKNQTVRGKYLDYVSHLLIQPLIFLSIGIHIFNTSGNILHLVLGFSTSIIFMIYFTNHKVYTLLINKHNIQNKEQPSQKSLLNIQKSLRYFLNMMAFFIIAKIGLSVLLKYNLQHNLTLYLLTFYFFLYLILFLGQTSNYYKNLFKIPLK